MAYILALASTVVLFVFMGYFALGSLPLLILKHDTPMDARFIRGFFHLYYRAVLGAAIASTIAWGFAGRLGYFIGMLTLAIVVFTAWKQMLPRMDAVREKMTPDDHVGIRSFRRLHSAGMALNAVQLLLLSLSLLWLKS